MNLPGFFKKTLPFLAAGLSYAGPAGQLAAGALGKVLNVNSPTVSSVTDALSKLTLTPELQAQLQQAEEAYRLQMQQMGFQHETELAQIGEEDRASARNLQIQTRSLTTPMLAYLSVLVFAFCIYMVGFRTLPDAGHDTLIFLLGIVASMVKDVYGYFFGSSFSSTATQTQNGGK